MGQNVCKLQNESQQSPNVPAGKNKTRCDSCADHNQQDSNIINAKNKPAVSVTGSRDDEDGPAFKLRRVMYKSLFEVPAPCTVCTSCFFVFVHVCETTNIPDLS